MRTWIKSSSLLVLKTIKRKRPWTVFYESLKFKVLFGRKKGHCLSIVFVWMKNQKDNKQLEACLLTEPWKVAWSSGGGVAALPYSDWYWLFLAYTIRQDRFARTAVGGWFLHFIFTCHHNQFLRIGLEITPTKTLLVVTKLSAFY